MILNVPSPTSPPTFKEGVILTRKASKALCLESFLDQLKQTWKILVYIDDRQDWIEEVYNHFSPRMIVIALHYKDINFINEQPNENLAKKHLEILETHHKWLNDDVLEKIDNS